MANLFPLYVFPEGALASSVITTVLVGVWVTVFFNLRFGWVLSGLVVPGYLTPLILLGPISAAAVVVEAILTYALVRAVAVTFAGAIGWTTFFGRDRFFALILASIAVRLVMDLLILPPIGGWLNDHYGLGFDWRRSLESFGLVVIALYANQFWKPGLVAGFLTSAVTIGLTLLIVRFGLMEFTNFRISDIGYLYELLAASLLASPKAYIILITTAFIASHLNLRAGLDFNGLLIPALIALQWYEPTKIVSSVVEAFVILVAASLVMRLPVFANKTIEGGRKLLLFFNISYLWKMLIGYGVLAAGVEFKTADAFGFGYLLSTLIALKLHDKGGEARMITALTVVSAQGALLGTAIGFFLSEGARALSPAVTAPQRPIAPSIEDTRDDLIAGAARPADPAGTGAANDDALVAGLRKLVASLDAVVGDPAAMGEAKRALALTGHTLTRGADGLFTVRQALSGDEGATIVIDPSSRSRLVVSLPRPPDLRGAEGASRALLRLTGARALVIEGRRNAFQQAHRAFAGSILQVRGTAGEATRLEVSGRYPADLDLVALERVVGPIALVSGAEARDSAERGIARAGFATLSLSQETAYRLTASVAVGGPVETAPEGGFAVYLREEVAAADALPVPAALLPRDLLYAEAEVLVPLLGELLPMLKGSSHLSEGARNRVVALDFAASRIGYSLRLVTDAERNARYLVLSSRSVPFGTFAFNASASEPFFVHVPTGRRDERTYAFGQLLFDRLGAGAMLVAGPARRDGRPAADLDMLNPDRAPGLYDLVSKLLIASVAEDSVSIVLRNAVARGDDPLPATDVVLSEDRLLGEGEASPLVARVTAELDALGLQVKRHDGSIDLAGFESGVLPQAGYLTARPQAAFLSLWTTPRLRAAFADHGGNAGEAALFRVLDIPARDTTAAQIGASCFSSFDPEDLRSAAMLDAIGTYVETGSPVALQAAVTAEGGYRFERLRDRTSGQAFLAVWEGPCVAVLVNLHPLTREPMLMSVDGAPGAEQLRDFADRRRFALYVRGIRG